MDASDFSASIILKDIPAVSTSFVQHPDVIEFEFITLHIVKNSIVIW